VLLREVGEVWVWIRLLQNRTWSRRQIVYFEWLSGTGLFKTWFGGILLEMNKPRNRYSLDRQVGTPISLEYSPSLGEEYVSVIRFDSCNIRS
jgi:hypothetical protein